MDREEAYAIVEYALGMFAADSHKREWWATCRAALTGLHATNITAESAHEQACSAADFAHGCLNAPTTPQLPFRQTAQNTPSLRVHIPASLAKGKKRVAAP